mmetsp:Transcript_36307/g.88696  ORF Transcript_36307/g.88696 Transcript_36307/m.88696 type:complete len:285 (+) Transcript_36307:112-966(+)
MSQRSKERPVLKTLMALPWDYGCAPLYEWGDNKSYIEQSRFNESSSIFDFTHFEMPLDGCPALWNNEFGVAHNAENVVEEPFLVTSMRGTGIAERCQREKELFQNYFTLPRNNLDYSCDFDLVLREACTRSFDVRPQSRLTRTILASTGYPRKAKVMTEEVNLQTAPVGRIDQYLQWPPKLHFANPLACIGFRHGHRLRPICNFRRAPGHVCHYDYLVLRAYYITHKRLLEIPIAKPIMGCSLKSSQRIFSLDDNGCDLFCRRIGLSRREYRNMVVIAKVATDF